MLTRLWWRSISCRLPMRNMLTARLPMRSMLTRRVALWWPMRSTARFSAPRRGSGAARDSLTKSRSYIPSRGKGSARFEATPSSSTSATPAEATPASPSSLLSSCRYPTRGSMRFWREFSNPALPSRGVFMYIWRRGVVSTSGRDLYFRFSKARRECVV